MHQVLSLFLLAQSEPVSHVPDKAGDGFFLIERPLILLTWVTFLVLAFILHKFVWNPVLAILEHREKGIKNALEAADKARKSLSETEEKNRTVMAEAERKKIEIIESARNDALNKAEKIRQDAEKKALQTMDDAEKEIRETVDRVRSELKHESGKLALEIAEKILQEKMNGDAGREMVDRIIKGM